MKAKNTELDKIAISQLKPYENNARLHDNSQIEQLANSIKEFGFVGGVIIDENNMILAGHGRIEAAKIAGLTEVPYIRKTDLTQEQKRAYILADNKLNDLSGWDYDLLNAELGEITLDMTQFGFGDIIDDDISYDINDSGDSSFTEAEDHFVTCPGCGLKFVPEE